MPCLSEKIASIGVKIQSKSVEIKMEPRSRFKNDENSFSNDEQVLTHTSHVESSNDDHNDDDLAQYTLAFKNDHYKSIS